MRSGLYYPDLEVQKWKFRPKCDIEKRDPFASRLAAGHSATSNFHLEDGP